jgi:hypothetical protein
MLGKERRTIVTLTNSYVRSPALPDPLRTEISLGVCRGGLGRYDCWVRELFNLGEAWYRVEGVLSSGTDISPQVGTRTFH